VEAAAFWRIHFRATVIDYPVGQVGTATKLGLIQSFSVSRDTELRVILERQNAYHEALFTWNVYL
jgi:hypothetical protein